MSILLKQVPNQRGLMKFIIHLIAAIFLYISVSAQTVNQNASSGTGNVYALLVGVSKYSDPNIPQLQFANKDAEVFADFLKSKAGGSVPKENIRLLTDSNASIAAVHMAIKWLVRTCKKDDMVFFYFSGHGDLESISMYNNAYLICYNTPLEGYVGMSLSVSYLNDIANTLSAKTEARVVLITDACHSGKMTANSGNSNSLVGQQLMNAKEKEIRIASSQFDQLSNEKTDWGGGRGVFSYYLEKGLKGLADNSKDGIVTMGEIKTYLESAMGNDPVLKQENKVQTPVFKGMDDFALAKVDADELTRARQQSVNDSTEIVILTRSLTAKANDAADAMPDDYFISLLKKENLEALTDSLRLNKLTAEQIAFALINKLKDSLKNTAGVDKLNELLTGLHKDKGSLDRLNEMLMIAFDDKVQEVINQYLKGDEAELERRRYYNIKNNGYDVYPRMLAVALQLTDHSSFYYNILQVKLHYFTGVTLRLKLPVTEKPALLIEQALAEQQKALALEKTAAYIYNELGILYDLKKQYADAEKNYKEATFKKSKWAIPWANLGGLYAATGKAEQGVAMCKIADSLQSGLQIVAVNTGFAYERSANLLYAEEYYRKAIDINSRHYLPFENLGYVYMNTTQYAQADSFFYEASLRKKGYHFVGDGLRGGRDKQPVAPNLWSGCTFDDTLRADDMLGYFAMGISAFYNRGTGPVDADGIMPTFGKNNPLAIQCYKKVISLDKKNPLVYHYLALVYYEQQQWEEAELMFRYAMENYMNRESFDRYFDSVKRSAVYPYDHTCYEAVFQNYYYGQIEDLYFIASLYEKWSRPVEAEIHYKKIIGSDPRELAAYMKLWQLLEKQSLYAEAENVLKDCEKYYKEKIYREFNAFYRRTIEKEPGKAEWNYKLGLLLYDHAAEPARLKYTDTIIWFPRVNREMFIPERYPDVGQEDLSLDIGQGTSDEFVPEDIHIDNPGSILVPGTGEKLQFEETVDYPRYDGIRYLKRAAELVSEKETLASINFKIGEIYVWAGSKKMALPYFENALSLDTFNATTRVKIVEMSTAVYKNRKAMEQLSYLYNKKQIDFPNRILFAKFNMYAGQFDSSKKLLNEAEAINPYPLPEITDLRGRLNLLSNAPDKAIGFYKTYLVSKPLDANTCYTLARLYAGKKNNAEAINWLEKAISLGFNYSFILMSDPLMAGINKTKKWNSLLKTVQGKAWGKGTLRATDTIQ